MIGKGKKVGSVAENVSAPFSSFHIEADRSESGFSVFVSGIIGITDFTDESVMLKSHFGRVCIQGKRLTVCVYEGNTVEVGGRVEDIRLVYGNKKN